MDKDELVVEDKNIRFRNEKMERELQEATEEKLRRAEAAENARFERPTIIEKFMDAILRLKAKKSKKKEQDNMIAKNNQNSR